MRKLSIIIPHYATWRWTAICVNAFKTFGVPVESEIIVCDNSPGNPSIKCLTETSLGYGVKIVQGDPNLPSHGHGYELCYEQAEGDWIFTAETDSFPTRSGWADEYVKASANYHLIGPPIPQSSGRYIHPAGAAVSRLVLNSALNWMQEHQEWIFCPGAAVALQTSDRPYHVVAHRDFIEEHKDKLSATHYCEIKNWQKAMQWQQMRCFDEDTFENYSQRTGIKNWNPVPGKLAYNKIGFEAGQWLSYFAQDHGFKCLEAPTHIEWMPNHHMGQAAFSDVFGGFRHVWCGTSSFSPAIAPDVREFKMKQMNDAWLTVPEPIRKIIETLEQEHA